MEHTTSNRDQCGRAVQISSTDDDEIFVLINGKHPQNLCCFSHMHRLRPLKRQTCSRRISVSRLSIIISERRSYSNWTIQAYVLPYEQHCRSQAPLPCADTKKRRCACA
eukprot:6213303-Pleurochrysis_carterae.AAC.5